MKNFPAGEDMRPNTMSGAGIKEKLIIPAASINEVPGYMRALAKRGTGEVDNNPNCEA